MAPRVIFLLAEHRQRQFAGRPQDLDLADIKLDPAGRQFRVVGALGAAADLAVDPHHPLGAQLLGVLERRRIRIGDALSQPVMVAQVDEQHAAMIADAMAPARQANGLIDIALAERAAGMGPVTMHGNPEKQMSEDRIGGPRPAPRSVRVYPRLSGAATE
jgi:hypothetical protein